MRVLVLTTKIERTQTILDRAIIVSNFSTFILSMKNKVKNELIKNRVLNI
jgi:hypothetical protein